MWTISSLYYRPIDWTVMAHAFVVVELCVGRNCLLPPFFLECSKVNFELWSANQLMRRWRHSQLGWACENAATLFEFLILVWEDVDFPLVFQKAWIVYLIVRRTIFRELSTGRCKISSRCLGLRHSGEERTSSLSYSSLARWTSSSSAAVYLVAIKYVVFWLRSDPGRKSTECFVSSRSTETLPSRERSGFIASVSYSSFREVVAGTSESSTVGLRSRWSSSSSWSLSSTWVTIWLVTGLTYSVYLISFWGYSAPSDLNFL